MIEWVQTFAARIGGGLTDRVFISSGECGGGFNFTFDACRGDDGIGVAYTSWCGREQPHTERKPAKTTSTVITRILKLNDPCHCCTQH